MRTLSEIYSSITEKFRRKSKLDVEQGTVIDSFIVAVASAVESAHKEIEANKKPHIYTGLSGEDIDSLGYLVNCPRLPDESDDAYLFRVINWNSMNQKSNIVAIEGALIAMTHASNVTYVPMTHGVGTATAYVIPRTYDGDGPDKAIEETMSRLKNVISPGSMVQYKVPAIRPVKVTAYVNSKSGDMAIIRANIEKRLEAYVNGIAPGDFLSVGEINRIGINEPNVDFFSVAQLYVDGLETTALELLQKTESKFLLDEIIWWAVMK